MIEEIDFQSQGFILSALRVDYLPQQDWIEEPPEDRYDDVRSSAQFVAEAVNHLNSPAHPFQLRPMLGDTRTNPDSLAFTCRKFIRVPGKCHARTRNLRNRLS